jgi:uncharacterized membrane protein YphA (DoxX/SURF4 family)
MHEIGAILCCLPFSVLILGIIYWLHRRTIFIYLLQSNAMGGDRLTLLRTLLFQSPWLYRFLRVLLGGVFILAGSSKLLDPRAFARIISAYGLLPDELLAPVAIGLPGIEVLAGVGLLFHVWGSLEITGGLLAGFLLVLGYAIWKNLDVDCGCFSQSEIEAGNSLRTAFLRDIGLMAISLYLICRQRFQNRSRSIRSSRAT